MAGEYEKPVTIETAINQIVRRRYLLPAIQRKFTWDSSQICVLFDSIMRNYPINTFMFWKVKSPEVKKDFRFYQILERYCERFEENNPNFDTKGHGDFYAVIDGQQRLTSLYIGLKGTYAYKLPRKWWPRTKDDSVLPPRKLYLNLAAPLDEESNEEMMRYEFEFLTETQLKRDLHNPDNFWFQVGEILDFRAAETADEILEIIAEYLQTIGRETHQFSRKILTRLYFAMRRDKTIHFYNETNQSIDHVLDIFIRTNHGGTPLTFSDLLMAIAVANWREDARQQIDDLVDQVRFGSDMEFSISRDFVLKAALMLTDADVRFKVTNFTGNQIDKIEKEWEDIKSCILEVFRLIRSFGLNDASLRAKNSAIPIAYYLFHNGRDRSINKRGLYTNINNKARHDVIRKKIGQWLHMSLLKRVFSGQTDGLLAKLRRIIRSSLPNSFDFPLEEIVLAYKGTVKDLGFDQDFVDRILKTQKEDASCFSILALLSPDLDFSQSLDIDHLHPASSFSEKSLDLRGDFSNPGGRLFYENPENWNGISNLQLLNSSKNRSKQNMPLKQWLLEKSETKAEDLLIPSQTDLSFGAFESFVNARSALLKQKLQLLVSTRANVRA